MGAVATEISQWKEDDKYHEMKKYLLSDLRDRERVRFCVV